MVASSEQHSAPVMVSKPAIAQARSNHPGAPDNRAVSAEVIKIPEPIIEPTTIIVASTGPSVRIRPDCDGWSLTWKILAREQLHLLFPIGVATRERNRPLQ